MHAGALLLALALAQPPASLQQRIDAAAEGDTLHIAPGVYEAIPQPFVDPLCGNCLEHATSVDASTGFRLIGKRLVLIGSGPTATTLITRAGYGVYLEDADGTVIRDLAVTGGRRDRDGNATDAAVVVRGGDVRLENLHLRDNDDRAPDVIVGIAGVAGREGAEIEIRGCRIVNNGWDGIALYRGAVALICDNAIERGRGAGIGITWDATALVVRNRVSGYWKGIGTFGASRAVVRNNAVFDNLGWGVIATGQSYLEASNNVIVRNGNCGFAVWSEECRGIAVNNVVADNGWRREWVCPRVGVWHNGRLEDFPVLFNDLSGNVLGAWRSELAEPRPAANFEADPRFLGPEDFRPGPASPLIDAGDSTRTDRDGSRSDIGLTGGAGAGPAFGSPPPRIETEALRVGSRRWTRGHRPER
jgi:hypothetical protein